MRAASLDRPFQTNMRCVCLFTHFELALFLRRLRGVRGGSRCCVLCPGHRRQQAEGAAKHQKEERQGGQPPRPPCGGSGACHGGWLCACVQVWFSVLSSRSNPIRTLPASWMIARMGQQHFKHDRPPALAAFSDTKGKGGTQSRSMSACIDGEGGMGARNAIHHVCKRWMMHDHLGNSKRE